MLEERRWRKNPMIEEKDCWEDKQALFNQLQLQTLNPLQQPVRGEHCSVGANDLTIGWQILNPLSHSNATQALQARPSGEILNYLLRHQSGILVRSLVGANITFAIVLWLQKQITVWKMWFSLLALSVICHDNTQMSQIWKYFHSNNFLCSVGVCFVVWDL